MEMPAGLTGYLNSVPLCSLADLATAECPPDSQVGLATTRALHEADPDFLFGTAPIYAVAATGSGGYGRLAFTIPTLDFTQSVIAAVRTGGDYGLRLTAPNLPAAAPLQAPRADPLGAPVRPRPRRGAVPAGLRRLPGTRRRELQHRTDRLRARPRRRSSGTRRPAASSSRSGSSCRPTRTPNT